MFFILFKEKQDIIHSNVFHTLTPEGLLFYEKNKTETRRVDLLIARADLAVVAHGVSSTPIRLNGLTYV